MIYKGFSSIAKVMMNLMKMDKMFIWVEACEKKFQTLKEKLTTISILAFLDSLKNYKVYIIYHKTIRIYIPCYINYSTT